MSEDEVRMTQKVSEDDLNPTRKIQDCDTSLCHAVPQCGKGVTRQRVTRWLKTWRF